MIDAPNAGLVSLLSASGFKTNSLPLRLGFPVRSAHLTFPDCRHLVNQSSALAFRSFSLSFSRFWLSEQHERRDLLNRLFRSETAVFS